MFTISKSFEFDYGHRVWTQELNSEYSIDSACKCRHLHGHRGVITIHLAAERLNQQGMVTDFKHLNWFKEFIDNVLDHKMILDIEDPINDVMFSSVFTPQPKQLGYYKYQSHYPKSIMSDIEKELYEGVIFVPFVPTSENLCKWFAEIAQEKMSKIGVSVSHVEFKETPKSNSMYILPIKS